MSIHQSAPNAVRRRLLITIGSLASLCIATFAAFTGSGCMAPVSHVGSAQASARPRAQTTGGVRTGAAYQKAVSAYRAHRYANALHLINTLLALPTLTEQDKTFLVRQQELCQAALSSNKPNASAATVPFPSSTVEKVHAVSPSERDCGPRALLILCQSQHVPATLPSLIKAAHTGNDGTSMDGLAGAAQSVGFHAEGVQVNKDALESLSRPAIAWVDGNHYVAVLNVHQNPWTGKMSVTIHDPNNPEQEELSPATLLSRSSGVLLVLSLSKTEKAS